jgi:hypothetical protein
LFLRFIYRREVEFRALLLRFLKNSRFVANLRAELNAPREGSGGLPIHL